MSRTHTIQHYSECIKNVKKWAKEKGVNLEAYDFNFFEDGFNCELSWNPKTHKMPYSELVKDSWNGGEMVERYATYIQLSGNCSSTCMVRSTNKEDVLQRMGKTRCEERLKLIEEMKSDARKEGLKLFALADDCDNYALVKARDIQFITDDVYGFEIMIYGGEYDGYKVHCKGVINLVVIYSDLMKRIAEKPLRSLGRWGGKKDKRLGIKLQ